MDYLTEIPSKHMFYAVCNCEMEHTALYKNIKYDLQ